MEKCDQYLLLEIFKQLQWEHLPTLSLVNKTWYAVTKSPILRAAIEKTRVYRDAGKLSESAGIWVRQLLVWKGVLVSGCGDGILKFWDSTGKLLYTQNTQDTDGMIESLVVWTPPGTDDELLVSGADFGQIKVWKKTEGEFNDQTIKPVLEMKHGPGTARLLVIGSDLYSGSASTIRLWNDKGDCVKEFESFGPNYSLPITNMVVWQGNIVASYFNETRMWDPKEGKLVKEFAFSYSVTGNEAEREKIVCPIKALAALENGWLVVGLENPAVLCVFDREGQNIRTTPKQEKSVFAIVPMQNARGVITIDGGGKLKVWYLGGWADVQGAHSALSLSSAKEKEKVKEKDKDYFEGKLVQDLGGHEHQAYCLTWWNGRLYSGDFLGVIKCWK